MYDRLGMFALLILFLVGGKFVAAVFYPIYNGLQPHLVLCLVLRANALAWPVARCGNCR